MKEQMLDILMKYIGDPYKAVAARKELLVLCDVMHSFKGTKYADAYQYLEALYPNLERWHYEQAIEKGNLKKYKDYTIIAPCKTRHDQFCDIASMHLITMTKMKRN